MQVTKFLELISQGFDVSFNYLDVFYTISVIHENNGEKKFGIGSDNGFSADFDSLQSIPDFVLANKKIKEIIIELPEEEIFY